MAIQQEGGLDRIQKRFDELEQKANGIREDKSTRTGAVSLPWGPGMPRHHPPQIPVVNQHSLTQWRTSVLSLLQKVFGDSSTTFKSFQAASQLHDKISDRPNTNTVECFEKENAIFLSAKSDYEGGYVFDIQNLANAVIFNDELEQASYLLDEDWNLPAAVIAGTVLESTLRQLCNQSSVSLPDKPKASLMNNQLKPAGVFGETQRAQNEAWLKIRNDAAHGKKEFESVSKNDLKRMIEGVRDFIAKHMN